MSSESRRNPRHACQFSAAAAGPRGALRGRCTNLSLGGLYFEGPTLPVGASTTLTVDVGARGTLRVQAQVRHQSTSGMGVQFTRFEPGQLELLQQVLAGLAR
ncbi:MAG: PilZ domain-containing protein [Myxococcaceae bacterium]|nr:PilZ domain-containing protein [Myxococcaceae bacterium]